MKIPVRLLAALVGAVLLVASGGCATSVAEPPVSSPSPTMTVEAGDEYEADAGQPGPFIIRHDRTELRVHPHTYCVRTGCADGVDNDPPSVGSPADLLVSFVGQRFDDLIATQYSDDDICLARTIPARVTALGDGWWRVEPQGPAGNYRVSLFLQGQGADAVADLRWTVSESTPLPAPEAALFAITDHDGEPDSYGVELTVANLAEIPVDATATITITAASGASHSFTARRVTDCVGEGMLRFIASASEGRAAAELGDFPFEYSVELTIDGERHVGTGTYPDHAQPQDPTVPLSMTPALR